MDAISLSSITSVSHLSSPFIMQSPLLPHSQVSWRDLWGKCNPMFGSDADPFTVLFPSPVEQTVLQRGKAGFDCPHRTVMLMASTRRPGMRQNSPAGQAIHPKGDQKAHSWPWALLHPQAGEHRSSMLPASSMCRLSSFLLTTRTGSALWAGRIVACGWAVGEEGDFMGTKEPSCSRNTTPADCKSTAPWLAKQGLWAESIIKSTETPGRDTAAGLSYRLSINNLVEPL